MRNQLFSMNRQNHLKFIFIFKMFDLNFLSLSTSIAIFIILWYSRQMSIWIGPDGKQLSMPTQNAATPRK